FARLPIDTWGQAQIPVGVRLELVGNAESVEISYVTKTDDLGYRGDGAGRDFELWNDGRLVTRVSADLGESRARLAQPESGAGRSTVYLPEGMRPTIVD